jgi:RNA polymerase sigma-70 factor (ECF subfamily)
MAGDDCGNPTSGPSVEAMRELAGLWVRSQSVISAYIAANVGDSHHVDDLVQEVAQVCAENFDAYDRGRSFVSWAMGIARNRILKYYRSRSRDRLVMGEAALLRLESALEAIEPESESRRDALRICLERVAGRRREVLELRYRENAKVVEIAERCHMSASSVSVMLHRVRTDLMRCIRQKLIGEGA